MDVSARRPFIQSDEQIVETMNVDPGLKLQRLPAAGYLVVARPQVRGEVEVERDPLGEEEGYEHPSSLVNTGFPGVRRSIVAAHVRSTWSSTVRSDRTFASSWLASPKATEIPGSTTPER